MLISKSQKLNNGNPIELRIRKSEDFRQSIASLQSLFGQYSAQMKLLSALELKLARELEFFYQGENIYNGFMLQVSNFLKFRDELFKKEIVLFDKELANIKNYEKSYETMTPFTKKYFKQSQLLTHYEEKLPKLIEMSELKRKQEGTLNSSSAKRLMRNQKKLEDARIGTLVATNNIIDLSNKLNIERFAKMNPMVSRYIHYTLVTSTITSEKFAFAVDHDPVLSQRESDLFNTRMFIEMDPKEIDRISRSHVFNSLMPPDGNAGAKSAVQYKQNVQNNYYVLNDPSKVPNVNGNGSNVPPTAPDVPIPQNTSTSNYQNRQSLQREQMLALQNGANPPRESQIPQSNQPIALPYNR